MYCLIKPIFSFVYFSYFIPFQVKRLTKVMILKETELKPKTNTPVTKLKPF